MSEKTPIPIRFDAAMIKRLDAAAKRTGQNRAGIVRFCVETWLAHFEKKGVASLPPDWEQILLEQDARRREETALRPGELRTAGSGIRYPDPKPQGTLMNDGEEANSKSNDDETGKTDTSETDRKTALLGGIAKQGEDYISQRRAARRKSPSRTPGKDRGVPPTPHKSSHQ